jgi:methylenetetrahydrofolate dehydrogenase (NADP+)/methenyltetrahydrofolate cyclohydrolase
MTTILLDGKVASAAFKEEIKNAVISITASGKRPPHLAAILVGNDGASETYVTSKEKNCQQVGFNSTLLRLSDRITEQELLFEIEKINNNDEIDGLIVQLPLPKHINEDKITDAIVPNKDVDGFHTYNAGKLSKGMDTFIPATPFGIVKMLKYYNIETKGKHAVVIGRSMIVGRPMSILLSSSNKEYGNATVTLAHRYTEKLPEITKQADIVVVAVGIPYFLKKDMIKEGAVVVDVGITRVEDASKKRGFKLAGDADFDNIMDKCSAITPVPGGVGLMTILGLLENTLKAYNKKHG